MSQVKFYLTFSCGRTSTFGRHNSKKYKDDVKVKKKKSKSTPQKKTGGVTVVTTGGYY